MLDVALNIPKVNKSSFYTLNKTKGFVWVLEAQSVRDVEKKIASLTNLKQTRDLSVSQDDKLETNQRPHLRNLTNLWFVSSLLS